MGTAREYAVIDPATGKLAPAYIPHLINQPSLDPALGCARHGTTTASIASDVDIDGLNFRSRRLGDEVS